MDRVKRCYSFFLSFSFFLFPEGQKVNRDEYSISSASLHLYFRSASQIYVLDKLVVARFPFHLLLASASCLAPCALTCDLAQFHAFNLLRWFKGCILTVAFWLSKEVCNSFTSICLYCLPRALYYLVHHVFSMRVMNDFCKGEWHSSEAPTFKFFMHEKPWSSVSSEAAAGITAAPSPTGLISIIFPRS